MAEHGTFITQTMNYCDYKNLRHYLQRYRNDKWFGISPPIYCEVNGDFNEECIISGKIVSCSPGQEAIELERILDGIKLEHKTQIIVFSECDDVSLLTIENNIIEITKIK